MGLIALVVVILAWKFAPELRRLPASVSQLSGFGVTVNFERWAATANSAGRGGGTITASDLQSAVHLAGADRALFDGARVLWIDDRPEGNRWERRVMTQLGARVDAVLSNAEALDAQRRADYDLIISDRSSADGSPASEGVAAALAGGKPPVIFYIGDATLPLPNGGYGSTTRPDALLTLVTGALRTNSAEATASAESRDSSARQ